jgi:hypothetical protein
MIFLPFYKKKTVSDCVLLYEPFYFDSGFMPIQSDAKSTVVHTSFIVIPVSRAKHGAGRNPSRHPLNGCQPSLA